MSKKPSYEQLEKRVQELEHAVLTNTEYMEALKKYRNIVSSTSDGIAFLDTSYRYILVNDAYERFSGVDREHFIGLTVSEYLGKEVFEQHIQSNFDRCLHGEMITYQAWFTYPTLGKRFVEVTYFPYRDDNNHITGVIANTRDITERKQIEERLRFQAHVLDSVEQAAIATNPTGTIIYCNAFAETLYGWSAQQVVGRNIMDVIVPQMSADQAQEIMTTLANGESWHGEFLVQRHDGSTFPADVIDSPIYNTDGKLVAIIGISSDITDRKQFEEALRQDKLQLRELNAQKDKFFSILAHDLRNPLSGFLSFADLLEQDFDRMTPTEQANLIHHFRASAEMLFALLNNLLTWARLQNGHIESVPDQFSLDQLVARAVTLLTPNAAHKHITLTTTVPSLEVSADISMTDTIVRNLLANAIKFTPKGGIVTITATRTANDVCVTVADTGIGLSSGKLAQLFRIDGKTQRLGTEGEKGTGLGLILCKEFVETQGGTIWVESEPGNGTRVMFTLPLKSDNRE